jgi:hypothetical protein
MNWSDIIAKVNADVESLIVVSGEKIDKYGRVCNNRQEDGTAASLLPCSHFGHGTIGKYRIHGGVPYAGGVTCTDAGICQPPSGIPAQTDSHTFYHPMAQ